MVELPRLKGQKDTRYTHLFSGMPDLEQTRGSKENPEQHLQSEDRIFELENNSLSFARFEELKNAFMILNGNWVKPNSKSFTYYSVSV